jgi:DNA-binding beta-propeller fold protein YncE
LKCTPPPGGPRPIDSAAPIAIQVTPDSLLTKPRDPDHLPFFIGDRPRLATCGGVAWFHERHIATVNLLGNAIHTYAFDPPARTLTLLQTLVDPPGLVRPENLAFSPGGDLLAVTNSIDGAVNLFDVSTDTHAIDPTPAVTIKAPLGINPHGVSFSPCGQFVLYSTVETPGSLRLFRIERRPAGSLETTPLQLLTNRFAPLKPKGVAFSPDGRFVVVSYGPNAEKGSRGAWPGFVSSYAFDPRTGCSPGPLFVRVEGLGLECVEDVNVLPDASRIVVTDQAADQAVFIAFDAATGSIGARTTALRSPQARMSFPHGNAVSADGRYLAVANYGDDTFNVYPLTSDA